MARGVAGTWNGDHGYQHEHRMSNREAGRCINCSRPRGHTIRCEPCRVKHNRESTRRGKEERR